MPNLLRTALYASGVLIVLTMTPIILAVAFLLLVLFVFDGTVDGRPIGFILLIALLPGGIGIWLFAYHLNHQIGRLILKRPVDTRTDYFGRWLSQGKST